MHRKGVQNSFEQRAARKMLVTLTPEVDMIT